MILDAITQTPDLFAIRRSDVAENGIEITFHDSLLDDDGHLLDDVVCVLKLDEYSAYNSKYTANPPKVIDNLIVVQCCDELSSIYLIELRKSNGKHPVRRLKAKEIEEKFRTAIHDFMEKRHQNVFDETKISNIKAYLVCDPWKQSRKENAEELFDKKVKSCALDAYASLKPFKIFGRNILINPIIPPNPIIRPC